MQLDVSFLPALGAAFMLVFARIGTMVMLLPGLGELSIPTRVRLTVAFGLTARLTISSLQVAGSIIAQQLGLGFVTAVDPTQGQQGVIVGNFLSVLGVTLIFATDLHHLVINALNDSYTLFLPGEMPIFGDIAALFSQTVAAAFRVGVQLSAPFIVFGLLFNLGLGVLSRLMPQMQVFFVGLPLSILVGLLILILVVGAMMNTFLEHVESVLHQLAPHS
jgi:flagellar biosynthetic protein FliR